MYSACTPPQDTAEGHSLPPTLGLENFCSCLKLCRILGHLRKPQKRQSWRKGGWLILHISSASELHVWIFSHPLQALPLLPCCIRLALVCIRPHRGSVQQESSFIPFSQTGAKVYCNLVFCSHMRKLWHGKWVSNLLTMHQPASASVHVMP